MISPSEPLEHTLRSYGLLSVVTTGTFSSSMLQRVTILELLFKKERAVDGFHLTVLQFVEKDDSFMADLGKARKIKYQMAACLSRPVNSGVRCFLLQRVQESLIVLHHERRIKRHT